MSKAWRAWMFDAAAVAALVTGCGDDDDEQSSGRSTERYCELVAEVEAVGEEVFADVAQDATLEEMVAAEAELVSRADEELEEMVAVAPEEIAEDVEAFVADLRARAEGESGSDVSEAEEAILAFEEANC